MIRPQDGEQAQYDLNEAFEGELRGWIWLDMVTANVVCQIYELLSPEQQEKIQSLPMGVVLNFCWRVANGR